MTTTDFTLRKSEFPSKFVDAGGLRTHYLEAGSGQPCVLVHGGGAGADGYSNWYKTIPILAVECRVIAVDMLGFGQTAKPDEPFVYSQQARNDHLASFIAALGIEGCTVVGNSMGGATGMGVCVQHPGAIGKLVLMGAAGMPTELPKALAPLINYDYTREGMIALMRALTNDSFPIEDEMVEYRLQRSLDPDVRRAYGATMRWVKEQHGINYDESFISRVSIPTLVANGKQDKIVSMPLALRYLDLIPRSWGYFIPNCGHWAMLEHPDEFAYATLNFIRYAK